MKQKKNHFILAATLALSFVGTSTSVVNAAGLSTTVSGSDTTGVQVNADGANTVGVNVNVTGSVSTGVNAIGFNGVVGTTNHSTGIGVYGENNDAVLPLGNGIGVAGKGYYGVYGEDKYSGAVAGAYGVYSNGNMGATGTKTFRIDHPLDPENKFLIHSSVESNEVLNMYRGNVVIDSNGEASVVLPEYFEAINRDFSYHLTPIGDYAPLFVKTKINDNKFNIGGGVPGMEVSWTVYAERNDLFLQKRPALRATEVTKQEHERGRYQFPLDYDKPSELGIFEPSSDGFLSGRK